MRRIIYQSDLFNIMGLERPHNRFGSWLKGQSYNPLKLPRITQVASAEIEGLERLPLDDGILYMVCIEANCLPDSLPSHPRTEELCAKWSQLSAFVRQHVKREFDRVNPHLVAIFQGYSPGAWAMRCEAISRNIPLLTFENTALSNRVICEEISGISVNQTAARSVFWRYAGLLDDHEVNVFCERSISETKHLKSKEHQSPGHQLRLDSERPVVLFLGQVMTDASLVFGLGRWRSPIEIIEAALEEAKELGAWLIVKLHPKESSGKTPILQESYNKLTYCKMMESKALSDALDLGETLIVDHENRYDTYDLIEKADVSITVNSQTGLESAIRGTPVILCGEAFYGIDSTFLKADRPSVLKENLRDILEEKDKEFLSFFESRAREFFYCFYEKFCILKSREAVLEKFSAVRL